MVGGTGHVGRALNGYLSQTAEIVVVGRNGGDVHWDGKTLDSWVATLEGADAVINLAGQSVNCRHTLENHAVMKQSRVFTTRLLGEAIASLKEPPRVWLQASTATIYAHRLDAANDEESGVIGGHEPGAPMRWRSSIEIAKAWEAELDAAHTPKTRRVAMRMAIVMSAEKGGAFDHMARIARRWLGGRIGDGKQYISWIHEEDLARAVLFLIEHEELSGPVNLSSPSPMPNAEFNATLRQAMGIKIGLPVPQPILELGMWFRKSDSELVLKSRRVIPGKLTRAGFKFDFETWTKASADLAKRWKALYAG